MERQFYSSNSSFRSSFSPRFSIQTVNSPDQTSDFIIKISGTYHNGTISLRQKPGGVSHLLTRIITDYEWDGSSISRTNDKTDWRNVKLEFQMTRTAREAVEEVEREGLEGEEAVEEVGAARSEATRMLSES